MEKRMTSEKRITTRGWTRGLRRLGAAAALPALMLATACDRSSTDPNGDPHRDFDRVEIIDRSQTQQPVVATWTADGGWDATELPSIDLENDPPRVSLGARVFDSDDNEVPLTSGGEYSVRYALASGATAGVIDLDRDDIFHGDHIHIYGLQEGVTQLQIVLWHVDHADGNTDAISIEVHGHDDHDDEALATVEIIDRGETGQPVVATWTHDGGWDGELPVLDLADAERLSLGARMYDGHGEEYTLEGDGDWSVRFWTADGAEEGIVDLDRDDIFHGDHVHLYGEAAGSTEVVFILWHSDHAEDQTDGIEFTVIHTE